MGRLGKFFLLNALLISLTVLSGCVYFIVGTVGAVGGYIVSPDTVEGIAQHDNKTVFKSTLEIISIMGIINDQNEEGGVIVASIDSSKVTVVISPLNDAMVKLSVKARRAFFPRISLAQDVFVKIMNNINSRS